MADQAFPKIDDADVKKAANSNSTMRSIAVGRSRPELNHSDGPKACSVYNAQIKRLKLSFQLEICKVGNKITFDRIDKNHLNLKQSPAKQEKK